jgi:proton-translocating NADH-quinone oxidoreductase chain N
MNPVYFIVLPLILAFASGPLHSIDSRVPRYLFALQNALLFCLALGYATSTESTISYIAVMPPVGIALAMDGASSLLATLFTLSALLFSLFEILFREDGASERYYYLFTNLLLAGALGLILTTDLFNLYVFIEFTAISAYLLTAYPRESISLEGALKYLIVGSVASLLILFAIILIYLQTGTLNIALVISRLGEMDTKSLYLIAVLLFVGFGFKTEIFPFNFWVADIYRSADSRIGGLFSAIVVKAYLFVFFRLYLLGDFQESYRSFLVGAGIVSMLVAEMAALRERNLKRIFAYSTLGQVGMIFSALAVGTETAIEGAFMLAIAHSVAKLTIFLSLATIERESSTLHIDILKRVRSPLLIAVVTISMLSLLGIPPMGGFAGKFIILKAFADSSLYLPLGAILVASLIEAVYYFRIIGKLYGRYPGDITLHIDAGIAIVLLGASILSICIGIFAYTLAPLLERAAVSLGVLSDYSAAILGGGAI